MVNNSVSFTYHAINLRKKKDKTNYFGVFFYKNKEACQKEICIFPFNRLLSIINYLIMKELYLSDNSMREWKEIRLEDGKVGWDLRHLLKLSDRYNSFIIR